MRFVALSIERRSIWKAAIRPTIPSNPSRKQSFWGLSSNRKNLKTPEFRFSLDGKRTALSCRKPGRRDNHVVFSSRGTQMMAAGWLLPFYIFMHFPGVLWTKNIWSVSRVKQSFWNSSDETLRDKSFARQESVQSVMAACKNTAKSRENMRK